MEWLAQDCSCCQHLQQTGEWQAERCQPVCARARFPRRVYAEWDLMCRVVKKGTFGVLTPMGGSVQTEYKVKEGAFKFWARDVARIPRRRWMGLVELIEWMHGLVEKQADGKFTFSDEEWGELTQLGVQFDEPKDGEHTDPD